MRELLTFFIVLAGILGMAAVAHHGNELANRHKRYYVWILLAVALVELASFFGMVLTGVDILTG